ncbi:MAG: hypothetical protein AAF799_22580 [Myxococcota bacterium]
MSPSPASGPSPDPALDPLRDEVLEHLWVRFPDHCVVLTDPRCRTAIDFGIARARHYGFVHAAEIRPFVTLMLMLGSHFDQDPQHPWAGHQLRQSARSPRRQAIVELLGAASQALEPVVGAQGEYYRRALGWVGARSFDALAGTYAGDDEALTLLARHLYRRKHDALGPSGVAQAVRWAHTTAQHYGLTTPAGPMMMLALTLLLGSAIDRDPFHPWVRQVLTDATERDPEARARRLHARAQELLARHTRLAALSQGTTRN